MADEKSSAVAPRRRILVAGGSGYIGSHTVVHLLEAGYDVVILDNLENSSKVVLERLHKITGKHLEFNLIDLCNKAALQTFFKKSASFDAVIHFAGLKAVGESVSIPLRYYQNNITGTLNLLEVMEEFGCRNIVFSSSATVYGSAPSPIKEDTPLSATNPYGKTKLFIEEILRDIAKGKSGSKWKIAVLRYFNPVGAHPSGLIGEDPNGPPNNLMPYISQVAVGRRPHLSVFGNDYDTVDGTGVRDYIHVMDLAAGHVAALDHAIFGTGQKDVCDAYNLGTGNGYSVLQMLKAMEKACKHDIPYKVVARRAGDVGTNFADPTKANTVLKWKAQLGLERMCADAWRWQSQNPHGFNPPPDE